MPTSQSEQVMLCRLAVSVHKQENFSLTPPITHTMQTAHTPYSCNLSVANIADAQTSWEVCEAGLSGLLPPPDPVYIKDEEAGRKEHVSAPSSLEERRPSYIHLFSRWWQARGKVSQEVLAVQGRTWKAWLSIGHAQRSNCLPNPHCRG